jgi:hypothetical protein
MKGEEFLDEVCDYCLSKEDYLRGVRSNQLTKPHMNRRDKQAYYMNVNKSSIIQRPFTFKDHTPPYSAGLCIVL